MCGVACFKVQVHIIFLFNPLKRDGISLTNSWLIKFPYHEELVTAKPHRVMWPQYLSLCLAFLLNNLTQRFQVFNFIMLVYVGLCLPECEVYVKSLWSLSVARTKTNLIGLKPFNRIRGLNSFYNLKYKPE